MELQSCYQSLDIGHTMIAPHTFENLVAESFAFLSTVFGFSRNPCTREYFVDYQRDEVFVGVIYDPVRSHELGILVRIRDDSAPAYELAEVLRAFGCPQDEIAKVDLVQTADEEVLKRFLHKCAELLCKYGERILRGETASFSELAISRAKSSADYTGRIILNQVAKSVEAAWESKNYHEVVRLLAPHRNILDPRLLRRLSFAEAKNLDRKTGPEVVNSP